MLGTSMFVALIDYGGALWKGLGALPPRMFWRVVALGIGWGGVTAIIKIPYVVRPYDPRPAPLFTFSLLAFAVILFFSLASLWQAQFGLGWLIAIYLSASIGRFYAGWREMIFRHSRWYGGRI